MSFLVLYVEEAAFIVLCMCVDEENKGIAPAPIKRYLHEKKSKGDYTTSAGVGDVIINTALREGDMGRVRAVKR